MKNRKILLVLPRNKSTVLTALNRALVYLGWEVEVFDYRELSYPEKLIRLIGYESLAYRLLNNRLETTVKKFNPSILFVVKGERLLRETLERIRSAGVTAVNWFPDDVQAYDLAKSLCHSYDYFLHFDAYAISCLKKDIKGVRFGHFPFAADIIPTDPKPKRVAKSFPVTLVGNYYPARETILPKIADLGLNIWGDSRWEKSPLAQYYHGELDFKKLGSVYQRSKIVLNIQYRSPSWSLVNRVYEAASAGSFVISEHKKQLDRMFADGKEIVSYETPADLKFKISYYLSHEKEREKIAANGYRAVRLRHTYVHRFQELFKELK